MIENYTLLHCHSDSSLLDSATSFEQYVDKAVEVGQKAIAFTEHGNIYHWAKKKMYCEKKGIKYIHGVELYLTQNLKFGKVRDNYHVILLAKNYEGFKEINRLVELSTKPDHRYFDNRITFEEFLGISDNVIKISACLKSPIYQIQKRIKKLTADVNEVDEKLKSLSITYNLYILDSKKAKKLKKLQKDIDILNEEKTKTLEVIDYLNNIYPQVLQHYDYYEIQPHNNSEQAEFNKFLLKCAITYKKALVVGTDTHSLSQYEADCRQILMKGKEIEFDNEDEFDLTYKTYPELVDMFIVQGALPEKIIRRALEITNEIADMVEPFDLDLSFKYPNIPGVDDEEQALKERINKLYKEKRDAGILVKGKEKQYLQNIKEEFRVYKKIGMIGFILFMSDLMIWCREQGIPTSPCRGSVGGSTIAYITNIIEVDPIVHNTIFSRFANEDRVEIGDIDIDIPPDQRNRVYKHIIDRFGIDHTAYVVAFGTLEDKGTIDLICKALSADWVDSHYPCAFKDRKNNRQEHGKDKNNPYRLENVKVIKQLYSSNPQEFKIKYHDVDYYLKGLKGCYVSQGLHPAGIVVTPSNVDLTSEYGSFWGTNTDGDNIKITNCDMDECHEISLVKYDILGLNRLKILRNTCELIGIKFPAVHEINWYDPNVWAHIVDNQTGIFQFEKKNSFESMAKFKPQSISDLTLVTAAIRPSGASYRDDLFAGKIRKNPSVEIDELLKGNRGYLVYQEDTIKFLQQICGLSGSEADNVRRAIARKQEERLNKALPQILEGYCTYSKSERNQAEIEATTFLKIIEDSSEYQFGYNHATGYSMVTYLCAFFRTYFPIQFITAYLNSPVKSKGIDSIVMGTNLAQQLDISYLNAPEYKAEIQNIFNTLKINEASEYPDNITYPTHINLANYKFGKSTDTYNPDLDTFTIYKGLSGIKGFGDSDIIVKMHQYYQKNKDKYNLSNTTQTERFYLFYCLVKDIIDNTLLKKNQLETLIKLNYFADFGGNKSLYDIYVNMSQFLGKSQINKKNIDFLDVDAEVLKKYIGKETASIYSKIDFDGYYKEYLSTIKSEIYPINEQFEFEEKYLGGLAVTYDTEYPYYYITKFTTYNGKYNNPYVTFYNLKTGNYETAKVVNANYFILNKFQLNSLIKCIKSHVVKKIKILPDGSRIESDEEIIVLDEWQVCNDYQII